MDWLDHMNAAMDYIEAHLADEISYDQAARLACCSTYHFQRMFSYLTGVPLAEYIRRRRLTLAAFELRGGKCKVIDVALKYGYESPEAFSRAFKKLHGAMPLAAREAGVPLKAYPRMRFHITIQGDKEMNYRILQREAFRVFGLATTISANQEEAFVQVPEFFRRCDEERVPDAINALLAALPTITRFRPCMTTPRKGISTCSASFCPRESPCRRALACWMCPPLPGRCSTCRIAICNPCGNGSGRNGSLPRAMRR